MQSPEFWGTRVVGMARITAHLMEEMQRGILKVFDLHHMVMKASEENKQLLVDIESKS